MGGKRNIRCGKNRTSKSGFLFQGLHVLQISLPFLWRALSAQSAIHTLSLISANFFSLSGNEYASYAFGDDYYDLDGLTYGLPIGQGYWEETVRACTAYWLRDHSLTCGRGHHSCKMFYRVSHPILREILSCFVLGTCIRASVYPFEVWSRSSDLPRNFCSRNSLKNSLNLAETSLHTMGWKTRYS